MPKVSIVVPFHWMKNWHFFLTRCLESIEKQSFTDYEVILTKAGSMPVNSNRAIQSAKGEIIKILYMDDYLTTESSLKEIVDNFNGGWLVTGCFHDDGAVGNYHAPSFEGILNKVNTIGSPSVLAFENNDPLLFDIHMSWLLDVELYARLYRRYGLPNIVNTPTVTIGLHDGQATNLLTPDQKKSEENYLNNL